MRNLRVKPSFLVLCVTLSLILYGCSSETEPVGRGTSEKVQVIAHRGFSHIAPENTKSAILLAWEAGCPAAECDVHLTQDKKIMLLHDESTERTSNAEMLIAETSSEELRQLDVGSWKSKKYAGEKMPFLGEIIETIPEDRVLYIEVKCGVEILPYLEQVIEESGKREQLVIISFNVDVVESCKKTMGDIPAYWLVKTQKDKVTQQWIPHDPELIQIALDKGLDGLNLHYAGINRAFAETVFAADLPLYAWTVDDPDEARRLEGLGLQGITTNQPDVLFDCLENPEKMN